MGSAALLLFVADGVGGRPGGAVASRVAHDTLERYVEEEGPDWTIRDDLFQRERHLRRVFKRVQERLLSESHRTGFMEMATTLTLVAISGRHFTCASVGDSPIATWDGSHLQRLGPQSGHTPVGVPALGPQHELTPVPCEHGRLRVREAILVASDGLARIASDPELEGILDRAGSPAKVTGQLEVLAKQQGTPPDDMTVVMARVENVVPAPPPVVLPVPGKRGVWLDEARWRRQIAGDGPNRVVWHPWLGHLVAYLLGVLSIVAMLDWLNRPQAELDLSDTRGVETQRAYLASDAGGRWWFAHVAAPDPAAEPTQDPGLGDVRVLHLTLLPRPATERSFRLAFGAPRSASATLHFDAVRRSFLDSRGREYLVRPDGAASLVLIPISQH